MADSRRTGDPLIKSQLLHRRALRFRSCRGRLVASPRGALTEIAIGFTRPTAEDSAAPLRMSPISAVDEIGTRPPARGWRAKTPLPEGVERTYRWFLDNNKALRVA